MNERTLTIEAMKIKTVPEIRQAYQEWLDSPMTQIVLEIVKSKGRPQLATPIDGVVAAQALGHAAGWANAISTMQYLDQGGQEEVPADYADENNKEA